MISTFKRNQHFKKVLVNKAFTHAQEQKKAMPLRHSAYILFSVRLRPLYKQINNYSYVRTIPTKWKKWAYNQFPYLLSSYLRIAIFKKGACRLSTSYPRPIYKPRHVYEIYIGKIEARELVFSRFQIVWRIGMPKRSENWKAGSTVIKPLSIILKNTEIKFILST